MGSTARAGQRASTSWGEWGLGDLADSLQTVSRLIGPSFPVVGTATVSPPDGPELLPTVELVVPDGLRLEQVKSLVAQGGDLLVPLDVGESERSFHAVADDVLLCVRTRD